MANRSEDSSWTERRYQRGRYWWLLVGLAGGFGGTAPNFFRIGTDLTHGDPMPTVSYLLGVMVFFVMGAALVLSFRETDVKKALFLGLSLPAMFQTVANDVSGHAAEAAAMVVPAIIEEENREFVLVSTTANEHPAFQIVFLSPDGKRSEQQTISAREATTESTHPTTRLEIPSWATRARLVYGTSSSIDVTLNRSRESRFQVMVEKIFWSGVQRSIGIKGVAEWEIRLEPVKEEEK